MGWGSDTFHVDDCGFITRSYRALNMPREAEPSLNERAFILQALQEGIRIDGRPFDTYRDLELSFGEEYGVVDVTLGKTRYCISQLRPSFPVL